MSDREKLLALKRRIEDVRQKTAEAKVEVKERRAKAREQKAEKFSLDVQEQEKPKKVVNSRNVKQWFDDGLLRLYGPQFIVPKRWTVPQQALAKRMLEDYGEDLVEKAVGYFCDSWQETVRKSRGRIGGCPSVNLLWAMRDIVFTEAQTGKTASAKDSDEYAGDKGLPKIGW